jgi:hypothetical protein
MSPHALEQSEPSMNHSSSTRANWFTEVQRSVALHHGCIWDQTISPLVRDAIGSRVEDSLELLACLWSHLSRACTILHGVGGLPPGSRKPISPHSPTVPPNQARPVSCLRPLDSCPHPCNRQRCPVHPSPDGPSLSSHKCENLKRRLGSTRVRLASRARC